jgi:hypothetical protein
VPNPISPTRQFLSALTGFISARLPHPRGLNRPVLRGEDSLISFASWSAGR